MIFAHLNKDPNQAKVRELAVIDKDILNKGQPQSRLRSPGIRTLPISSSTVPEVDAGDGDVVAVGDVQQHLEVRHHRSLVLHALRRDVADPSMVLVDVGAHHLPRLVQERPVVEHDEPPVSRLHPLAHRVVLQRFLELQLLPKRARDFIETFSSPSVYCCDVCHTSVLGHPRVVDKHLGLLQVVPLLLHLVGQDEAKLVRVRAVLGEVGRVPCAGGGLLQQAGDLVPRAVPHKAVGSPLCVRTSSWDETPAVQPDLGTGTFSRRSRCQSRRLPHLQRWSSSPILPLPNQI